MKIFKSQYFFYIILSALLVILGISFAIIKNKTYSDNRYFLASVALYNRSHGPVSEDIDYYGKKIYAIKPNIVAWAGTTDLGDVVSKGVSVVTDPAVYNDGYADPGYFNRGQGGISTWSFNSTYYKANVHLSWPESSTTKLDVDGTGSWTETISASYTNIEFYSYLDITAGKFVTCNFYDTDGTILTQLTGAYASYLICTDYKEPYAKHFTGWKVGFAGNNCGSSRVRVFSEGTSLTAEYYATYEYNKYTITFDKRNGSGGTNSTTATYSSKVPKIEIPSRTGYNFKGYYTGISGSGVQYYNESGKGLISYGKTSNITLYAHWEPIKYYVQFNANGGSGTMNKQQLTYDKSQKLDTNLFTRAGSGLCFGGWKKSASGSSVNYAQGTSYKFNLSTTENATVNLYVHWIKEKYNLVFDYLDQSTIVTYGQSYTFPLPTRTGYIFKGWYQPTLNYTFKGKGTIPDFGNDGSTNTIIEVDFEAIWEPINYLVNFDGNGATSGSMVAMEKTFDTYKTLSTNRYIKAGYNFVGWSLEPKTPYTCEDAVWQNELVSANWSRYFAYKIQNTEWTNSNKSNNHQGGDIYFVTGSDVDDGSFNNKINSHGDSITLYTIWEAVDYQLVFDGNNATRGSMTNQARIYDVRKALPNNTFERNGYLFLGWHRDKDLPDAGQVEYNNLQSIINIEYFDQETKTSRTVVEGDQVTLYAVWKETWAVHNEKPSGSGSTTDPYLISNAQNLAWLSWKYEEGTSFDNGTTTPVCIQTANIDLSEYEWLPIGNSTNSFMGNYDGNGYVITSIQTNLITGVSRTNIGLFGYSKRGTIKNVRIWGNINGNSNVGGILGYGLSVMIENCTNNATVIGTVDAGGIVDYIKGGKITSCYNYGNITGWTNSLGTAGGIVAYGEGVIISKCYSTGTISAGYSGGIAGIIQSGKEISSSVFEGTVYGTYSGAISGFLSNVTITNCFVKGQTANKSNKGLYAQSSNTVKFLNCIIDVNDFKGYTGTDFSNWIISSDGRPLPSELSWLAIGGEKVTDISQISANYTKF